MKVNKQILLEDLAELITHNLRGIIEPLYSRLDAVEQQLVSILENQDDFDKQLVASDDEADDGSGRGQCNG